MKIKEEAITSRKALLLILGCIIVLLLTYLGINYVTRLTIYKQANDIMQVIIIGPLYIFMYIVTIYILSTISLIRDSLLKGSNSWIIVGLTFVIILLGFTFTSYINMQNKFMLPYIKDLVETKAMLTNTRLEKFDYIEKMRKTNELTEEKLYEINSHYREVDYRRDPANPSKFIEVDFSLLEISCDTYNKILPAQKTAFPDAKIINSRCSKE